MMEPHDTRDLDGIIDDVARAMTSTELPRDLRGAVASRVASRPSWAFGWRTGLAAAALAAVALAAVVSRPRPETEPPRAAAVPALETTTSPAAPLVAAREEVPAPRVVRRASAARRQIVDGDADAQSVVEIEPLAILPLGDDRAPAQTQARIEIAPIQVESLRIRELGEAAE